MTEEKTEQNIITMQPPDAATAVELLKHALDVDPADVMFGNARAYEVARLAAKAIKYHGGVCPFCGGKPWENTKCGLCEVCSKLEKGGFPAPQSAGVT